MELFGEYRERESDSPLVEKIIRARVQYDGSTIRPAEAQWHLVIARHQGEARVVVGGLWTSSGTVSVPEGAEVLWIKLKLGAFMPHLPIREYRDSEITLPQASGQSFWLHGSAWSLPDFESADTFVRRLEVEQVLAHDPLVDQVLQGDSPDLSPRTIRHRFERATGLTQAEVAQFARAKHAAAMLEQGTSILDTVFEAGYYDQPHLTRALRRWLGHTPAEILRARAMAAIAV